MSARPINGRAQAAALIERIRQRVSARLAEGRRAPGLAVILVGEDPASHVYVRNKRRACEAAGLLSVDHDLPAQCSESELLDHIARLNADPNIDGILVQLPLPPHIDADRVIASIHPDKDVDGFHAENLGRLALRRPWLRPCTPRGVMAMLAAIDVPIRGRRAVVIGVSNHVGRPMVQELMIAGATVSACHRFTDDLAHFVGEAEILIAAAGRPGLIRGEWVRPGAVVVDIGINRLSDGSLCGDIEYAAAAERASWITPVPGGVGPMTVATLLTQVMEVAEASERA